MLNNIKISPKKQILIVYIALTIVTLAVFRQVNRYDFINIDDGVYITENSHIQTGITLEGVRWAFSTTYAEFWHPLTWLSLMFDYQLHGLNSSGYHLTNLILHIMSTLLLFWLFIRMTGAIWKSAFVAAIFALHPLHVESVAWISERKDVLSVFFWMLTLCLYVYYTEKPVIKRYLPVLFCFACGLMSKPIVVTLPLIMILLDYWPLRRFESRKSNWVLWQLKEKIPFFILSAVFAIITIYAQVKPTANVKYFSLTSRLANASVTFVIYLEKTFWPHDLAVFYPFPGQIPLWQISGAILFIFIISAAVIVKAKQLPHLLAGWLWYAITLLPVIGIIQVGCHSMADRYTYLPLIGIAVMLTWGIPSLIKSEDIRKKILFPSGIAVLAILAVFTWQQCGYWKNSTILLCHTLQITKDNYLAHNNLGAVLLDGGKTKEAFSHFNEALRLNPDYPIALYNRGTAYYKMGQDQLAIEDFNKAVHLKEDYADAYNNRGNVYLSLGQYQLAIEDFNRAVRLKPNYVEAYYSRAVVYLNQGRRELGCSDAQKACLLGICTILKAAKGKGDCR